MENPLKLFEENKRLAYHVARRFKDVYSFMNVSELRNVALYNLWESAKRYDEGIARFSTYAYINILRRLQRLCDKEIKYRKRNRQFYMIEERYDIKEDIVINLKENNEYDIEELDKALYETTPDQKIALIMRSNGLKCQEISKQLRVSKQAVSFNYKNGIRNLKKHLGVK